ncbi:unnamed protein product [Effrenium voratum]|nr:unnamed protein product [Effrenium voratum]CAJ1442613.1 unnamed protein product [Effrenium voratum]
MAGLASPTFFFDWKDSLASVKNTFIHVSEDAELDATEWWGLKRTNSSPGLLESAKEDEVARKASHASSSSTHIAETEAELKTHDEVWDYSTDAEEVEDDDPKTEDADFASKLERNLEAHRSGNCKPCSYFYFKEDGCRNGDFCDFCHFCSPQAVKDSKRRFKRDARREKRAALVAQARQDETAYVPCRYRLRGRRA